VGHRVSRDLENDAVVLVDLDFGDVSQAVASRDRLLELWKDPSMPATARADVWVTETTDLTAY
jgi:hypothetical protein